MEMMYRSAFLKVGQSQVDYVDKSNHVNYMTLKFCELKCWS